MSDSVGEVVASDVVRMTRFWKYCPCTGWPALSTSCPLFSTTAQLDQLPSGVAVLPTRTWTVMLVPAGTLAVQLAVFHVDAQPEVMVLGPLEPRVQQPHLTQDAPPNEDRRSPEAVLHNEPLQGNDHRSRAGRIGDIREPRCGPGKGAGAKESEVGLPGQCR